VINLSTKFEVSISTRYKDTKDDTKYRKWGGLGQLGVTQRPRSLEIAPFDKAHEFQIEI